MSRSALGLTAVSIPLALVGCLEITNDNQNSTTVLIEDACCGCCEDDCCEDDCDTAEPVDTGTDCECPEGFAPTPDGDACFCESTEAATYNGTTYEVCEGNTNVVYGKFGARYPNGTTETSDYWGDDDSQEDGRLNEIGIWTCEPMTADGQQLPVGEWIGFSVCLEVEQAGDYLIGIAGDNRVRFELDGTLVFEKNNNNTENFDYWWVEPISLSSGTHIIELSGYNAGAWATFGAEIRGPFPASSMVDDASMMAADYENNIIWSTDQMLGFNFDVGEDSGWICPDGYAVDTCEEEPVCTLLEYTECL